VSGRRRNMSEFIYLFLFIYLHSHSRTSVRNSSVSIEADNWLDVPVSILDSISSPQPPYKFQFYFSVCLHGISYLSGD
jgi:hypothetical protein